MNYYYDDCQMIILKISLSLLYLLVGILLWEKLLLLSIHLFIYLSTQEWINGFLFYSMSYHRYHHYYHYFDAKIFPDLLSESSFNLASVSS